MPKGKIHLLTVPKIEALKFKDTDYMESDGGGLYMFIRHYGVKEWIFRFTSPITTTRRKQSLGSYPDTPLKEARRLAQERRDMLDKGIDPINEFAKQQEAEIKAHAVRKEKKKNTIKNVFVEWKRAELQNRKDSGLETERAFEKDVFPEIGSMPIGEVTRSDIKRVLERPLKRKSKRMANKLLSDLKQFFGYADDEELIVQDPTRRMFKERVGGKEKSRDRYLTGEELKLIAQKLPSSTLSREYQAAIWLILATGCRVNEISAAEWKNIDLTGRTLHIPKSLAKNGDAHNVHLSDFALTQLEILRENQTTEWLLSNRDWSGPLHRQTLNKQITDRQQVHRKKIKGRTQDSDSLILPSGRWTIHDLRRTAATTMQELGIMPHIVKRCLNQRTDDKMARVYQRAAQTEEQKNAFNRLGEYLRAL